MTKMILENGDERIEVSGDMVFAFTMNPEDTDGADLAISMLGHAGNKDVVKALGNGVAAIINQRGGNDNEKAILFAMITREIESAIESEEPDEFGDLVKVTDTLLDLTGM